jgi:hypothetical protein
MLVILVAVITQGVRVPREARGHFSTPVLTANTGIFQAIGVISFGEPGLFSFVSLSFWFLLGEMEGWRERLPRILSHLLERADADFDNSFVGNISFCLP